MKNLIEFKELLIELIDEDKYLPKNVKEKLVFISNQLSDSSTNVEQVINGAKDILSEISDDPNIESFSRTQIWNLSLILEE